MQPSEAALRTLRELASADPEFALELAVSPRAALGRVRTMFSADDHRAIEPHANGVAVTWLLNSLGENVEFQHQVPEFGPSHVLWGGPEGSPTHTAHPGPITPTQPKSTIGSPKAGPLGGVPPAQVTPYGPATLRITTPFANTPATLFEEDLFLSAHSAIYAFGNSELQGAQGVPLKYAGSFQLANPAYPLTGYFDATPLQHNQPITDPTTDLRFLLAPEAQFFARDPEEFAERFDSLPTDQIVEQTSGIGVGVPDSTAAYDQLTMGDTLISMPDSISLMSPIGVAEHDMSADEFYGSYTWNLHPGPIVYGGKYGRGPTIPEIRAVRVQLPGLCTREDQFADLFGTNGDIDIVDLIKKALSSLGGCNHHASEIHIKDLIVIPLLRQSPGFPTAVYYQLFLAMTVYAVATSDNFNLDCAVSVAALYDFGLDANGALTVSLAPWNWVVTDHGGTGCADPGWAAPFISLAEAVGGVAGFPLVPGSLAEAWESAVLAGGIHGYVEAALVASIPYSINWQLQLKQGLLSDAAAVRACWPGDVDLCADARHDMCNLVREGFQKAPLPFGGSPNAPTNIGCAPSPWAQNIDDMRLNYLLAAVNDSRYWICQSKCKNIPTTSECNYGGANTCRFLPPIQRMMLSEDRLQVVFYDSTENNSLHNASLAAAYAMIALNQAKTIGSAINPNKFMCNYQRPKANILYRKPHVFYKESICLCPEISPDDQQVFGRVVQVDDPANYYVGKRCVCPPGTQESWGLCCALTSYNSHGMCCPLGKTNVNGQCT